MSGIVAKGLALRYGGAGGLGPLDLSLGEGERLAVLGPSGAGKTTLLRLLAGLEVPEAGSLELGGEAASAPGGLAVPPAARRVGFVFQELALWPHLDVVGTLAYVSAGSRAERRERAEALARQVGLAERLDAFPDQLSGGEQQRLALARALAPEPRLLLLDEPFAHLDAGLRRELQGQVLQLTRARPELTLVAVTHQAEEALALGERLLILEAGAAQEEGPAAQLVERPQAAATARALGLGSLLALEGSADAGWRCALGEVELADAGPETPSQVLVRPGALRVGAGGAPAEVVRVDLLPEAPLRYRVELALGEARLWIHQETPPAPGERLELSPAGPLPGVR